MLDTAGELGYSRMPMESGAGHDPSYMNQVCPTAMIFVPSIGGRSHVEVENTRWEDCEAGANAPALPPEDRSGMRPLGAVNRVLGGSPEVTRS